MRTWIMLGVVLAIEIAVGAVRGVRDSRRDRRVEALRTVDEEMRNRGGVIATVEYDKHGLITAATWRWANGEIGSASW